MATKELTFELRLKDMASGALKSFKSQINDNQQAMADLNKVMLGVGAAAVAGFAIAEKHAIAFNTQMRNVNSIAKLGTDEFNKMQQEVINMSTRLPQSTTVLAQGLYNIVSSGFEGAKALEVLNVAAKGASAGLTTTDTSARILTAVLNSFGQEAYAPSKAMDILFKTVDKGVVSFEELAQQMGDTLPAAAATGVSLEELGAAFATLTRRGLNAAESATSLTQIMNTFLKPTDEAKETAKALGIEFDVAALRSKGLVGVIKELTEKTGIQTMVLNAAGDGYKAQVKEITANSKAQLDNISVQKRNIDNQILMLKHSGKSKDEIKAQTEELRKNKDMLQIQANEVRNSAFAQKNAALDTAVSTAQMTQIIQKAGKDANLSAEQMASLFGNVRSLRGILSLTLDDGELFNEMLGEMKESAGATDSALKEQSKSLEFQMNLLKNNIFAVTTQALVPFNEAIAQNITKFNEWAFAIDENGVKPSKALREEFEKWKPLLITIGALLAPAVARWAAMKLVMEPIARVINIIRFGWSPLITVIKLFTTGIGKLIPIVIRLGIALWAMAAPILAAVAAFVIAHIVIIAIVLAIVAVLALIIWKHKEIAKFITDAWKKIQEVMKKAGADIKKALEKAWTDIKKKVEDSWKAILKFLQDVWDDIKKSATDFAKKVVDIVEKLLKNPIVQIFTLLGQILIELATIMFLGIVTIFLDLAKKALEIWTDIKKTITDVMNSIWSFLSSIWNQIYSFISNILNQVWNTISSIWNQIYSTVSSILEQIWNRVRDAFNTIANIVREKMDQAFSWGSQMFWNLYNGIASVLGPIWDKVREIANGISNAIWEKINQAWGWGNQMFNNIKSGIDSAYNNVVNAARGIANGIRDALSSLVSDAWGWGRGIVDNIVNGLKSALEGLKNVSRSLYDRVKGQLGLQEGGFITTPGMYMLHRGEYVMPQTIVDAIRRGGRAVGSVSGGLTQNTTNNNQQFAPVVNITVNGGGGRNNLDWIMNQALLQQQYRSTFT